MQQPSRRQFVAVSLAGLPMLAHASAAAPEGLAVQGAPAAQGRAILVDPVLESTVTALRELVAEGEARPQSRKGSARAIEATLGIQAAHVGLHYDAQIQRGLRRRQGRVGRGLLVDEVVRLEHGRKHHAVTHEMVDATLTKLAQTGFSGYLRDLQRSLRAARLDAPDAFQAAAFAPAQFNFCADVKMAIEAAEVAAGMICSIAVLEPTLALEPFCAAAGLILASYKALEWWYC